MSRSGFDALREHIEAAESELADWLKAHREETPEFFAALEGHLLAARSARSLDELDLRVKAIVRAIVDSGPISGGFLPSLHALADALDRRRQRR